MIWGLRVLYFRQATVSLDWYILHFISELVLTSSTVTKHDPADTALSIPIFVSDCSIFSEEEQNVLEQPSHAIHCEHLGTRSIVTVSGGCIQHQCLQA